MDKLPIELVRLISKYLYISLGPFDDPTEIKRLNHLISGIYLITKADHEDVYDYVYDNMFMYTIIDEYEDITSGFLHNNPTDVYFDIKEAFTIIRPFKDYDRILSPNECRSVTIQAGQYSLHDLMLKMYKIENHNYSVCGIDTDNIHLDINNIITVKLLLLFI
jgi:hypothetical protein